MENQRKNMKTKVKQQKNQGKPMTNKNNDNQSTTNKQLFRIKEKRNNEKKQ
jgi:hypothetical protein